MKRCSRCKLEKPLEDFSRSKGTLDGRGSHCRRCRSEYSKEWNKKNPERSKYHRERCRLRSKERHAAGDFRKPGWEERDRAKAERLALSDEEWQEAQKEKRKERKIHLKEKREKRKEEMLLRQEDRCAICETLDPGVWWHLDHDHDCCAGAPIDTCGECDRGVLCGTCNVYLLSRVEVLSVSQQEILLRYPDESSQEVFRALEYLAEYRSRRSKGNTHE